MVSGYFPPSMEKVIIHSIAATDGGVHGSAVQHAEDVTPVMERNPHLKVLQFTGCTL